MSNAVGSLVGAPGTEAPPSRLPSGLLREEPRPTIAPAESETLEERVGQPRPKAVSTRARIQGRAISYKEFIAAVRGAGALESPVEAEGAARAVLAELGGCISWPLAQDLAGWLPKPFRQLVSRRSFETSMSRFAPQAFLERMAEDEHIGLSRAARDTRAVLLALDRTLPASLTEQLHSELASLWTPLTYLSAASSPQSHV